MFRDFAPAQPENELDRQNKRVDLLANVELNQSAIIEIVEEDPVMLEEMRLQSSNLARKEKEEAGKNTNPMWQLVCCCCVMGPKGEHGGLIVATLFWLFMLGAYTVLIFSENTNSDLIYV